MRLPEFNFAIDDHLSTWNPTTIIRDNEATPTANTYEFIRLTVLHGLGLTNDVTGVYSVNGSRVLHSFILNFSVFTKIDTTTDRNDELCQAVLDHWQVRKLGPGLELSAGTLQRIGEEPPRYHTIVQISGTREETLTKRS